MLPDEFFPASDVSGAFGIGLGTDVFVDGVLEPARESAGQAVVR